MKRGRSGCVPLLVLLWAAAGSADAAGIYRCEANGSFVGMPSQCPAGAVTVLKKEAVKPAAKPAPGKRTAVAAAADAASAAASAAAASASAVRAADERPSKKAATSVADAGDVVMADWPVLPANGAPVHVISISGRWGVIDVNVEVSNAVLLLFSPESVEWRLHSTGRGSVKGAFAAGVGMQRVSYDGADNPLLLAVEYGYQFFELLRLAELDPRSMITSSRQANDLIEIASVAKVITGALPASYQGGPSVPDTGFLVQPQTPPFALPAPIRPAPGMGLVTLRSPFPEAVVRDRLMRGYSGRYTEGFADRAYSAGKVYFEARIRVAGTDVPHAHANVGMCLADGQNVNIFNAPFLIKDGDQRRFQNGDVFGVAVDLDSSRMYYRVNSRWRVAPESREGYLTLKPRRQYRACALSAGTTANNPNRSDTTWEFAFEPKHFRDQPPEGYTAYRPD